MTNSDIILNNNSWVFDQAKAILKNIDNKTPKKGYVLFETGYGPSGLPHIGTFGEVVRTSMVRHAFRQISDIPTKLFCVSDDIDALRKVPENLPNQELITQNLGKPLTQVPDPFETHPSYGEHMNSRLQAFLDRFGFDYEFVSATKKYKGGQLDEIMKKVAQNYEAIMNIMLPSLGAERQATYSPFMPICPETGRVLASGVKEVDAKNFTLLYENKNGEEKEISILGGNCKLQWKVDFGARWAAFDVDYEIYGKDHYPNEKIYRSICKTLGGKAPVNFFYEMFLSEDGAKISKSKGNGITIDEWLKYSPQESLSFYMYQKPRTAKRLHFDVIPKAMDEYLAFLTRFPEQDEKAQFENPVYHIHQGTPPPAESSLSFSLLLNLASACNPEDDSILWGFISKYQQDLSKESAPLLDKMVSCAINYYQDFIKPNKEYRKASEMEEKALLDLKDQLSQMSEGISAVDIQSEVYEIGKKYDFANLRDWFSAIYEILLGQKQGPRVGSFIALYGLENSIKLITNSLAR